MRRPSIHTARLSARIRIWQIAALLLGPSLSWGGQIVAFGDSLSDGGYYFGTRFTDPGGLLWHEQLADRLGFQRATPFWGGGNGLNLAVGGSTVSDLRSQIDRYDGRHSWLSGDLVTLWIGGNDLLDDPEVAVAPLVDAIGAGIGDLADLGVDHFLVPNLPDLGAIPSSQGNAALAARRTAASIAFNQALAVELTERASLHSIRIDRLEIFAIFQHMLSYQADFGFSSVDTPLQNNPSAAPETYAFWDDIHPSSQSHAYIAAAAQAVVDPEAGIEVVSWTISNSGTLRQTWFAAPSSTYQILSGTDPGRLSPATNHLGQPVYTGEVPAPGTDRGFFQTRRND